jgi:hypothetical protein
VYNFHRQREKKDKSRTLRMLPSQLMRSTPRLQSWCPLGRRLSFPFLSDAMQTKETTPPINQPHRAGRGCRGHRRTTAWGRRASVHRGAVRRRRIYAGRCGRTRFPGLAFNPPRVPGLNTGSCNRRDPLSLSPYCHAWNRTPVRADVSGRAVCKCNAMQPYHTTGAADSMQPSLVRLLN